MNDLMTRVAEADPDFARSLQRNKVLSYIFALIAVLAIGGAAWAVGVNFQQGTQITRIESPCLKYGSKSPQCKEAFEAAVATITHPQACAIERKAGTLRAIRELATSLEITFSEPCAGARIEQERQRDHERAASRGRADAAQPAPIAGQPTESPTGGAEQKTTPHQDGGPKPPRDGSGGEQKPPAGDSEPPIETTPPPESSPVSEPERVEGDGPPESPPAMASPPKPGLLDNPGGLVGEVACGLNRLLPVCTE